MLLFQTILRHLLPGFFPIPLFFWYSFLWSFATNAPQSVKSDCLCLEISNYLLQIRKYTTGNRLPGIVTSCCNPVHIVLSGSFSDPVELPSEKSDISTILPVGFVRYSLKYQAIRYYSTRTHTGCHLLVYFQNPLKFQCLHKNKEIWVAISNGVELKSNPIYSWGV